MTGSVDDTRIRASARRIGLLVGVSSALVIALGIAGLVAVIFATSRPEFSREEHRDPQGVFPGADQDHIVIDVDRVVPAVVVFGVVAVLLLGVIAWASARRAVRPLGAALRLQRNFVADASHELRTPLAGLSSRTQILERRYRRGEDVAEVIQQLRRDADAMADVLTELLTAAAADAGSRQGDAAQLEVVAWVDPAIAAALERVAPLAAERGVELRSVLRDGEGSCASARLSETAVMRACTALLDNAIAHSPDGAAVTLRAACVAGWVEIRVADCGPGISVQDRSRVFERFARGAETGRRRGFGLGLALVRDTAVRGGGTVEVAQTSSQGTEFVFRIPCDAHGER